MTESLHLWRARAEALGWQVTESLTAIAEPAGLTTADTYAAFKDEILRDLTAAGSPDLILLSLHGAMVAVGCEDCEGDLTAAIRAAVPGATIGVSLDLHCHLTGSLLTAADLVVTFKHYPHDDATPRAAELWDLALRTHAGEIAPVMAMFDCRMIGLYLTKTGPMVDFVARLQEEEMQAPMLSISLSHAFPWGDVHDVGARMLVITDNDRDHAGTLAEELGRAFYDLRESVTRRYPSLPTALDVAATTPGTITLADMADNPGAGAPGDATYALHEVLTRGLSRVAAGLYFDPRAVSICREAGQGADITLRLGGKTEPASGPPADLEGRIIAIREDCYQHLGPGLEPMGTCIWFRIGEEVDLVINDCRVQVYHPEAFTQLGIDLGSKRLIVVKSTYHFFTPFDAISDEVIFCATPGRVSPDLSTLTLTKRTLPWWPRDANPWST